MEELTRENHFVIDNAKREDGRCHRNHSQRARKLYGKEPIYIYKYIPIYTMAILTNRVNPVTVAITASFV